MAKVAGFIAAGGRSSRMGRDKAWLEIGGRPMIERVIEVVRPVTSSLSVIANDSTYFRLGLRVLEDTNKGIGPLEAIRTALANSTESRALIVACDLPLVTTKLFEFLVSIDAKYQAVIPVGRDGRMETLCGLYARDALECVTKLIGRGDRMVRLLFSEVSTRFVSFNELKHLPGSEHFFENVNSETDYLKVRGLTEASDPAGGWGVK
ncbi:MAG TPA: molybdenum cofactor guanylyltransferase [Blastocatellia bacterium]|nr:molybdenum cofactor guanylyltransferase [Blastocatellia bacterium]